MFYSDEQANQEQREQQQEQAAYDRHADGSTDAAFAQLPVYADPDYLKGWMDTLLTLPRDDQGRIQWHSPRRQFAFGWMDGDRTEHCEEF